MVEVLTAQEVALLLKLHPRTVMKMATSGEIPAAKVGRQWRFERNLIEDWLAVQMAPSRWASVNGTLSLSPGGLLEAERAVILDSAATRDEVLPALAARVDTERLGLGLHELVALLEEREAMFPTATELGVAFPHPRHPITSLETPVLVLGVVPKGLDFGAPGGSLTYVFVMICSPDDRTHVHLLSLLARMFRGSDLVEQLRSGSSPRQILQVFRDAETTALADQKQVMQRNRI